MSHSHTQTLSPRRRRLGRRSPSVFFGARSRLRPRFDVMEDRTLLSTWMVNNTADSGPGSLRQAILDSNAATGATNTIDFAIPGTGVRMITPLSPLPAITNPVLIDGESQPGYDGSPLIELSGSRAGGGDGLNITGSDVTVRGLDIGGFASGAGIHITGPDATQNWIYADFLGTDPTGTRADPNRPAGVEIDGGASRNLRRGQWRRCERCERAGPPQRKWRGPGVWIKGRGTIDNVVAGDLVGTSVTGDTALPNGTSSSSYYYYKQYPYIYNHVQGGVVIAGGASSSRIGSDLIGDNDGPGVQVGWNAQDAAVGNAITADRIFGNTGQAIDLGDDGVTVNGTAPRQGPDNLQDFPIIVPIAGGQYEGWLGGSEPDTTYRIDLFAGAGYGPGGAGEAQDDLGSLEVTTGANGQVTFAIPFTAPAGLPVITATATDPDGNTSEVASVRQGVIVVPSHSIRAAPGQPATFSAVPGDAVALQDPQAGPLDADVGISPCRSRWVR